MLHSTVRAPLLRVCLCPTIATLGILFAFASRLLAADAPVTAASSSATSSEKLPNIVFLLADDIGYGDFGCYGATKVKTPNVNRVAREGIRFTNAHATGSVCTPTRYAFITGQYAWRNPAGAAILNGEAPLAINASKPTTASLLRQAGYTTGIVGKWHIGLGVGDLDFNKEIKPGPLELGFDYAFFYPATNDRVPCVYIENHRVVGLDPSDPIRVSYKGKVGNEPTGKEHPELLTMKLKKGRGHDDTIIDGISRIGYMSGGKSARWKDTEMADTLAQKAVAFIERSKDKPFFLYLATHDIHVPHAPHPRFRGTSGCGVRGDAIQELDMTVGAITETLQRLKLADNTLLIVTSDNGGIVDDGYDDGSVEDLNGHRCNGVLRGFKGSLYEGGHREPFIARWPGKIKPGSQTNELIGLVDMLATFAAIAGQKLPADAGPDSFNVLPTLFGGHTSRDHLVVQSNGIHALALLEGKWKFIPPPTGGKRKPVELYNLDEDLSETHDVASKNPKIVEQLSERMQELHKHAKSRP